ncbi:MULTISPECIES: heparinase II/III family protein [Paenibacillus]|uniref:heparinase II/III family protein n=1 Tax=Paenibacillus TaxID=44249 RepID=UPI0022B898F5|nr:heparinase II/III family protein [Paenibacillus caseinilyticus]MCZ8522596.1 heparinase II/III family protein [Paenibacillus caseinilyticus]
MIHFNKLRAAVPAAGYKPPGLAGGSWDRERLGQMRQEPLLAGLLGEIRQEAQRAAAEPLPPLPFHLFVKFAAQGSRLEFEAPYFERRGRLLALGMASVVDETDAFLPSLNDLLWEICSEYSWALPAHLPSSFESVPGALVQPEQTVDLFAAETAHALAEALYLLEGRLDPWVVYRVREEIERRVFRPLFETARSFGWETADHNWSSVCAGAAGMAAMLLVEDENRLAGMLDRCIRAMECFLDGYAEDGCCLEGIGYWNYGFGYYVYFADMLERLTAGQVCLLEGEKIARIAAFPESVALTVPQFINYSDASPEHRLQPGLNGRLSARFGHPLPPMAGGPSLHSDHCYRWPHTARNLQWTGGGAGGRPAEAGTVYYRDAAWFIDKSVCDGAWAVFSAKGGHNDEPHNHNDLGHFIVHLAGDTLLADLGAGVYTKDYFGEGRYGYLHNSSDGHSVPLINGTPQRPGAEAEAVVIRQEEQDGVRHFELELTEAYPAEARLSSYVRTFAWSRGGEDRSSAGELLLTDRFGFGEEGNRVEERFISLHQPRIGEGQVTWQGGQGAAELSFDAGLWQAETDAIPTADHHGHPVTVYRTRLVADNIGRSFEASMSIRCRLGRPSFEGGSSQ